jgi:predicted nucleic acid-binding protein
MVLVDTSVWIRFFKNQTPYAEGLDTLLAEGAAVGHEMVYGELFVADVGGRQRWLSEYKRLLSASVVRHNEVVDFVRSRRLHGRGIGWLDAHLLASATVDGLRFWTADVKLEALADELSIAYRPS